jgi:hypothetical protein
MKTWGDPSYLDADKLTPFHTLAKSGTRYRRIPKVWTPRSAKIGIWWSCISVRAVISTLNWVGFSSMIHYTCLKLNRNRSKRSN